ncbi:MAG: PilZ domain-containing protein [Sphingomonadaceae bacterium]|nr:PilZ domain-containing protein [Sphingomonadaceae bacterium]
MMGYMTSQYRKVAPARLEQREAVRHPVLLGKATVRRHAKHPIEARLVDLSIYGCRVLIDGGVKVGDRLWLRLACSTPTPPRVLAGAAGRRGAQRAASR